MKQDIIKKSIVCLMLVTCNSLMSMNSMGSELEIILDHDEFEIALKNDDKKLIKSMVEDYKKHPENINKDCFIALIKYKKAEIFDELLEFAEQLYEKNKIRNAELLINLFLDVVNRMMIIIHNDLIKELDLLIDDKTIYTFLEKFFGVIQRMGYNPFTLTSKNGYTPPIRLLGMYKRMYDIIDPNISIIQILVGIKPNQFLDKVIHYFIEIGVPIYANKNADSAYELVILKTRPTYDFAGANPEMQSYFKLIGRYNKKLFNANEGITNIEVLKKFITNLKPEEQDAIFMVAATRGHMKPLAILGKLDKKYSMDEAKKLAQKRNLAKIVTMFEKRKTISNDIICALKGTETSSAAELEIIAIDIKNIGIQEQNKFKTVAIGIKDMLNRANLKRFDALVNEFRKKD